MATNSTASRDYILKSKVKNSLAIDSKEFMLKKPAELLEIARNNSLIYIYHDSIDALGDDASSEIYAFDGAEKAIEEISKIVTKSPLAWNSLFFIEIINAPNTSPTISGRMY